MSRRSDTANHVFRVGQKVVAQWPGTKMQYQAKVIKNGPTYELEYEDGTRHKNVPVEAIRAVEVVSIRKSPRFSARQKALNDQLAQTRNQTSRTERSSPGRTKSPGRTTKSPTRKNSPSRTPRSPSRNSKKSVEMEFNVKLNRGYKDSSGAKSQLLDITASLGDASHGANHKTELRKRGPKMMLDDDHPKTIRAAALHPARVGGIAAPGALKRSLSKILSCISRSASSIGFHIGGSFGILCLTLLAPALVLYLNLICTKKSCALLKFPEFPHEISAYFSTNGTLIYLSWFFLQVAFYLLPIGRVAYGQPLRDGRRLPYRINGFLAFLISIIGILFALISFNMVDVILDNYIQMLTTSLVVSFVIAIGLGIKARSAAVYDYSVTESDSSIFYSFFMGRELNPRITKYFDLKMFLELRPGVIGWGVLNVCFLYKDYQTNSLFNASLAVSAACQLLYVADALYFEKCLLTTMDITTEGLGFMLIFGDLTFVPFIFTLQSRFLMIYGKILNPFPWFVYAGIVALNLLGYFVFRASNLQKNAFRRNRFGPTVANLATISTGLPSEILAGGWWGWLRHPNYFGDILMAVAWCLPCGFNHIIPYTYVIYLTILLLHRAIRDDSFCQGKYGDAWTLYCKRVPSRVIPRIF